MIRSIIDAYRALCFMAKDWKFGGFRMIKRLLTAAALAGVFGLTLMSTASLAGPLMFGPINAPVPVPKVFATPVHRSVPVNTQLLNTYREIRSFWLSRAIVR